MNLIDRAILSLAPERGLRRLRARTAAKAVMNYDAASRGRRTQGWKAPATSADSAAFGSRERLRNLSRDMIRNRPYAARAQAVVCGNVVGTGIVPAVACEDEGLQADVQKLVQGHLLTRALHVHGEMDLFAMQRVVMNAVFSDGELIVRQRIRRTPFNRGLELPFQVELLEADQLDMTKTGNGQNEVIEGLEYDPIGRVVAYHLLYEHPGDLTTRIRRGQWTSERVPADQILHVRRIDRPGQRRGVPWLAPVMLTLGELADYQEAQILKQRVAALMAFFVESEDDIAGFNGAGIEELQPGAVVGLKPGQKVVATDPPTVEGYDKFMRQGLAAMAMGIGVTYESLAGDLSGVNFSSGRMGRMEMDRLVESWQQFVMIEQFCGGIGRWFANFAGLQLGRSRGEWSLGWTAPRRALIDPNKEIPAIVQKIEAGLSSTQREQRALGLDPETVRRERSEDQAAGVLVPLKGDAAGAPAAMGGETEGQDDDER